MLQDVASLKPNVIVEPYMGNTPLWSLAYEWWFYMLYFPLKKYVNTDKQRDSIVFLIAIVSSAIYIKYPHFITRLLMYTSIWWTGVTLSNLYSKDRKILVNQLFTPILSLAAISIINLYSVLMAKELGTYTSIGVHPALEFRHHFFALIAVFGALFFQSIGWLGFLPIFKPFLIFAPISYTIYISHHYFITTANYLSEVDILPIRILMYFIPMLLFCCVVELLIYPFLQKKIFTITNSFKPSSAN